MLSVSRSFCARVPDMGRYRLTAGLRLPRFGAGGKRLVSERSATQVELPMAETRAVAGERVQQREPERVGWWRRWGRRWGQWWHWVRKPAAERVPRRRPVQTAFLLESVKVVRNDLMDADLELVRIKKRRRVVSGAGKAAAASSTGGGSRPGLGRTAVRWLTAGRMS
jgi:hypothetical protein